MSPAVPFANFSELALLFSDFHYWRTVNPCPRSCLQLQSISVIPSLYTQKAMNDNEKMPCGGGFIAG